MIGPTGCFLLFFTSIGCVEIHHARMAGNEAKAITEIHEIQVAQMRYRSRLGHYAASLRELQNAGLIDASLAAEIHNGYRYHLESTGDGYTVGATPNAFNETGSRSFFSDQTKLIHEHNGPEVASVLDPQFR